MNTAHHFFWRRLLFLFNFSVICILMVGVTYFAGEKITSAGGADSAVSAQSKITVIIDAGHGGIDCGASAEDGTLEKHLNLAVAMKIKALLSFADVNVVMTRESDVMLASPDSAHKKRDDLNARLHMAEKYEDCIFVSIHMNKFPVEKYSGLQVYYSGNNPGSELLAEAIREKNTSYLQTQNSRGVKKADSSIYVLDNIRVPAVLVECGFLSNREEAALLKTEAYQDKLAAIICAGILEYIDK